MVLDPTIPYARLESGPLDELKAMLARIEKYLSRGEISDTMRLGLMELQFKILTCDTYRVLLARETPNANKPPMVPMPVRT